MKAKQLLRYGLIGLLAAAPVGGFLFGLLHAGDPDPNPLGRLVYAFMMAGLTPWHGGFPPNPLAGPGQTYNVWPYMGAAFAGLFGGLVVRGWNGLKK